MGHSFRSVLTKSLTPTAFPHRHTGPVSQPGNTCRPWSCSQQLPLGLRMAPPRHPLLTTTGYEDVMLVTHLERPPPSHYRTTEHVIWALSSEEFVGGFDVSIPFAHLLCPFIIDNRRPSRTLSPPNINTQRVQPIPPSNTHVDCCPRARSIHSVLASTSCQSRTPN